jgi:hypothetical protein
MNKKRERGGDISKLPKWAQSEILVLEKDVESLTRQVNQIVAGANSRVHWSYGENENGLPEHATVTFKVGEHKHVRVRLRFEEHSIGRLNINCDGGSLIVHPGASNDIDVSVSR